MSILKFYISTALYLPFILIVIPNSANKTAYLSDFIKQLNHMTLQMDKKLGRNCEIALKFYSKIFYGTLFLFL